MYCHKCGTSIHEGSHFCSHCGSKLNIENLSGASTENCSKSSFGYSRLLHFFWLLQ
ncbi:zinc ribbon domain-containing protein [Anaerobacillus sp. CMMVII]|nr:zinc ribbon domain-containing protein [Anaerobacillus sp. CMMVII]